MRDASAFQIRQRCIAALASNLIRLRPDIQLDKRGYVPHFTDNLVNDITPDTFEADLAAGAGEELRNKFLAPHSSSALAVNSFAWFKKGEKSLPFPDHVSLALAGFEQKFPNGLARATAPHLDVVFSSPDNLIAIESKCLEYLTPKKPDFSSRYRTEIRDERVNASWYSEMVRLMESSSVEYRHLDAAQLIKHALGLSFCRTEDTTLLYLWWEPENWKDFPIFIEHRSEVKKFADRVSGSHPSFLFLTYCDLWREWANKGDEDLARHVRHLEARYAPTI